MFSFQTAALFITPRFSLAYNSHKKHFYIRYGFVTLGRYKTILWRRFLVMLFENKLKESHLDLAKLKLSASKIHWM